MSPSGRTNRSSSRVNIVVAGPTAPIIVSASATTDWSRSHSRLYCQMLPSTQPRRDTPTGSWAVAAWKKWSSIGCPNDTFASRPHRASAASPRGRRGTKVQRTASAARSSV